MISVVYFCFILAKRYVEEVSYFKAAALDKDVVGGGGEWGGGGGKELGTR